MSLLKKMMTTTTIISFGLLNVALADELYSTQYMPSSTQYPPSFITGCGGNWCNNLSVYGAWLYWKAGGDELDYAVDKTRTFNGSLVRDDETIHDLKFNWDSGFRIGAGLNLLESSWRTDVVWTHFQSSSSQSKRINGADGATDILVSLPAVYNFGTDLGSGDSADFNGRIKFRYNTVDFELSKWCCCNDCVQFRPHAGIRLAEIQEGFHDKVFFFGGATESFSDTNAIDGRFFAKNCFKGVGLRAGLDLDLCLCEGWSFIGRGAASILWGRTHISQHFKYSREDVADLYEGEISENYRNSRVITDLLFGIRYKTECGCYPITAELAWEHHYIFGQHRFWVDNSFFRQGIEEPELALSLPLETTSSWKKNGDLSLQGLTLTIGIDF